MQCLPHGERTLHVVNSFHPPVNHSLLDASLYTNTSIMRCNAKNTC